MQYVCMYVGGMQERMNEGNEVFRLKGYRKGEFRKDGCGTGEMMDRTVT